MRDKSAENCENALPISWDFLLIGMHQPGSVIVIDDGEVILFADLGIDQIDTIRAL